MNRPNATRQRGAALLVLLGVLAIGASWFLVSKLDALSASFIIRDRNHNAVVVNKAKQALIGYIAAQASKAYEDDPGRLPCPEAPGFIGGSTEGTTASTCTLPAVGRFPWRSIGTEKLFDSTGEPLWYVVSPGWAYTSSNLTINSNSTGQLLLDPKTVSMITRSGTVATVTSTAHGFKSGDIVKIAGATPAGYNLAAYVTVLNANQFTYTVDSALSSPAGGSAIRAGIATVALIVAPGRAMSVQAGADCAARNQARSTPSPTINALDYLECYNTATAAFSTSGPSGSFNDQVLRITVADVMPAIEAAIANRIEREIVPVLTVYANPTWGTFPFPAPSFPPDPTTSSYLGQISPPLYKGLLPFNYHSGSCGGDVRCSPDTITWNSAPSMSSSGPGPGYLTTPTSSPSSPLPICTVSGSTPMCEGYYYYGGGLNISMTDALTTQIANGLRTFTLASHTGTVQALRWTGSAWVDLGTQAAAVSRNLASNGAANFIASGSLPTVPTWGYYYIRGSRPTISDHSILSSTDPTTGWFVRNEWYRLVYYAIAPNYAAGGTLSCTTGGTCLSVANGDPTHPITPAGGQRAILILAGRSINGSMRPSATLANYLEFGNATGAFERQPVSNAVATAQKKPFNDRVIVVQSNP